MPGKWHFTLAVCEARAGVCGKTSNIPTSQVLEAVMLPSLSEMPA